MIFRVEAEEERVRMEEERMEERKRMEEERKRMEAENRKSAGAKLMQLQDLGLHRFRLFGNSF
jgi:hypothetical protein